MIMRSKNTSASALHHGRPRGKPAAENCFNVELQPLRHHVTKYTKKFTWKVQEERSESDVLFRKKTLKNRSSFEVEQLRAQDRRCRRRRLVKYVSE